MAHKTRNPYKPLRHYAGAAHARTLCPAWRMVWAVQGGQWCETSHLLGQTWHDGEPPAPVGVVCDEQWRPVAWTTEGGHRIPRLAEAFEVIPPSADIPGGE